ncbi:unnamed protein product [Rodentolepis nana]|uniref:Uncharacterized protein n=1 Tax=Rodentolepis nana TaxID=102285 RepID=A0A3P7TWG3_RODNA|nr:unnamed protein product [Rodentolepis nana]
MLTTDSKALKQQIAYHRQRNSCFARFYSHKQKKNHFVGKSSRYLKIQVRPFDEIKEDTTITNNVLTEPFRPCELNAAIKQLKCKQSPGEDDIHSEFLIRMGPTANETMLTLFNKIWETSLVPNQWKVANTSTKKGKDPSNFDQY